MKCGNHVNNKNGELLVEQPVVKSWVLNKTLLELLLAAPVWCADGSDTAATAAAATPWGATPW